MMAEVEVYSEEHSVLHILFLYLCSNSIFNTFSCRNSDMLLKYTLPGTRKKRGEDFEEAFTFFFLQEMTQQFAFSRKQSFL